MLLVSKLCSQLDSSFIKTQIIANVENPLHQSRILWCFKVKYTFRGWFGGVFFLIYVLFLLVHEMEDSVFSRFSFQTQEPKYEQDSSDCHVPTTPEPGPSEWHNISQI